MAEERYYPNEMAAFIPETTTVVQEIAPPQGTKDSLAKLLSLPHNTISQRLKQDALNLKDQVLLPSQLFISTLLG